MAPVEAPVPASVRAGTLVEVLRHWASHSPDDVAFRFLRDEGTAPLTYLELDRKARAIAARLQRDAAPGERALLLYRPGLDFIAAFCGCLYGGVVPVPLALPRKHADGAARIHAVARDTEPTHILTTHAGADRLPHLPSTPAILATDGVSPDEASNWSAPQIGPDTLALLQYTSGSTGVPRGVMVSQRNLLYNQAQMATAFGHDAETVFVSWVPMFHDMGLISMALAAIYTGRPCILLSPTSFVRRPVRWLRAIDAYGGTVSAAPNFAYDLCVRRISEAERADLDLSTWRVALNAAEPVRARTLARFSATFASCGFRPATFYPCYGLAETTVFATGGDVESRPTTLHVGEDALAQHVASPAGEDEAGTVALVSCGHPWLDQEVRIVDPDHRTPCPDGIVGEIWLSGSNVARGYWKQPGATRKTFEATIREPSGASSTRYLRTGDLGFVREGKLFVTGRLKDLIILRGRNVYPHDLEWTASRSHELLRNGVAAAFSVEAEDEERLVLVQGVRAAFRADDTGDAVVAAIQRALGEQHDVAAWRILLVPAGQIPRTTSGKIRRSTCRRRFLDGSLGALLTYRRPEQPSLADVRAQLKAWPAPTSAQQVLPYLQRLFAQLLREDASGFVIGATDDLFDLGVDSLTLLHVVLALEEHAGRRIPTTTFVLDPTLEHLAHLIAGEVAEEPSTSVASDVAAQAPHRSLGDRFRRRLVEVGPQARGRAVPYRAGTTLLHAATASKWLRRRFVARECAMVRQCLAETRVDEDPDAVVRNSLMTNAWAIWRRTALRHRDAWERWVTVRGRDAFEAAKQRDRGVVVAFHHTPLKKLLLQLEPLHDLDGLIGHVGAAKRERFGLAPLASMGWLGTAAKRTGLRTAQLAQARRILQDAGTVLILADDTEGRGGVWRSFHGRWRPFRTGTAELAIATGASIVPLFASMDVQGCITFSFEPVLASAPNLPDHARAAHLTHQYADRLAKHWRHHLGSVEWSMLRRHLLFPRASN